MEKIAISSPKTPLMRNKKLQSEGKKLYSKIISTVRYSTKFAFNVHSSNLPNPSTSSIKTDVTTSLWSSSSKKICAVAYRIFI